MPMGLYQTKPPVANTGFSVTRATTKCPKQNYYGVCLSLRVLVLGLNSRETKQAYFETSPVLYGPCSALPGLRLPPRWPFSKMVQTASSPGADPAPSAKPSSALETGHKFVAWWGEGAIKLGSSLYFEKHPGAHPFMGQKGVQNHHGKYRDSCLNI